MSLKSLEQLQNRKWIDLEKINVEKDEHKIADVTNNQKWVSPNTATK